MRRFQKSTILLILALVGVSLFSFFSCAGKKPVWGDAKTGFILSYRFEPGKVLKYSADQKQNIVQEMMGQSMEIKSNVYSVMFLKGIGLDQDKNLLVKVGFDTLSLETSVRGQEIKPDMSPIVGKEFDLTLSPLGKKLAFNDPDSNQVDFGPMAGKRGAESFFKNPLPGLPDHPVKIGDSWTSTDSMNVQQSGLDILVKTTTKSTLEKMEVIDGIECAKVSAKITGTVDGSGNQGGMDIYYEGDLDGTETYYFDYKTGKLIQWENKIFTEGTVAVSGMQNMTIPMTQESTTKIQLLK